jgi:hypothetical protein
MSNRVIPLTCSGHTRPVVDLQFSPINPEGKYYLISACKGKMVKKKKKERKKEKENICVLYINLLIPWGV